TATSLPAATNTSAPTATATAPPTATPPLLSTDTPTAAPTDTPSLLDELEASGVGKYVGAIAPISNAPNGAWTRYLYAPATEQAICLRGGQYQVNVHQGTTNKVLLYLEGGGACWNNESCWTQPSAKLDATPFFGSGILLLDRADNPFHGWHVVYAPYCDGSVFAGDNIVDYAGGRTYHHGLQNLSAAVTLMLEQFPDPELVVVSGSSAGGYGTFAGYGVTRVAYPDTPILVLNDSGPGVQNPESTQDIEDRQTNWRINETIPATCTRCSEQYSYLTEWALQRDPTLRYGLFSSLRDAIIRSFNDLDETQYEALLRAVTGDIQGRNPDRFKRFLVQGAGHTM
ncbi:MAG: pectin acetylesterase-family hydrolase, partial [Myxococcota bacterium]